MLLYALLPGLLPGLLLGLQLQVPAGASESCEAHLADTCWTDVAAHIDCLLNPRSIRSRECERPSSQQLCSSLQSALHCTLSTDLDDLSCELKSERENFDFWVRGMEAVYSKLCFDNLMSNVVSHAVCWDSLRLTRCVQHSLEHLQHVVDLASLPGLGTREQCHLTMLRVAKCAALAAAMEPAPEVPPPEDHPAGVPYSFCAQAPPVDIINDLLAAYFSASECGGAGAGSGGGAAPCPQPPQPPPPPSQPQPVTAAPAPAPSPAPTPRELEPSQELPLLCSSAALAAAASATLCTLSTVMSTMALVKFL
ncbi:Myosin-1 [Frankliniella fusca]|uniref:Myosin-1 n=1 Tax=Frankliniella fusca TaxID=407009 RepID=A0AAE1GVF2_9NEOP|nr:Myosin-1 [Frankliniella fusca]